MILFCKEFPCSLLLFLLSIYFFLLLEHDLLESHERWKRREANTVLQKEVLGHQLGSQMIFNIKKDQDFNTPPSSSSTLGFFKY